jgi:hypothetical protein
MTSNIGPKCASKPAQTSKNIKPANGDPRNFAFKIREVKPARPVLPGFAPAWRPGNAG